MLTACRPAQKARERLRQISSSKKINIFSYEPIPGALIMTSGRQNRWHIEAASYELGRPGGRSLIRELISSGLLLFVRLPNQTCLVQYRTGVAHQHAH